VEGLLVPAIACLWGCVNTAFVFLAFKLGAKAREDVGYVIKTRAEKELLDQATEREEKDYAHRRGADYLAKVGERTKEAARNVSKKPREGFPMPDPTEIDDLLPNDPTDWTKALGTERMKEYLRAGP
jgi:hypothetical protein